VFKGCCSNLLSLGLKGDKSRLAPGDVRTRPAQMDFFLGNSPFLDVFGIMKGRDIRAEIA
jgi:hypothetical protein